MRRLINVLVGLVALGIAGGVVVCAIPKFQQAAARSQCQDNLKQLGLGLQNYYGTYDRFPSATIPNENLPCCERLSYLVELVPFLESFRLNLDKKKGWQDKENLVPEAPNRDDNDRVMGPLTPPAGLRMFRCPTVDKDSPTYRANTTNYVGISGVGPNAAEASLGSLGVGFFGCERQIEVEDIKDGSANTLAMMETNWKNGPWTAGGFSTVRSLNFEDAPYVGVGRAFGSGHRRGEHWWSPTTSVVFTQAVFADGSVRALSAEISPEVLEALATIAGAEETPPPAD